MTPDTGTPQTRDDAVGRARALFPLLRGGARRADDDRHLLPEMVEAVTAAGLVRTLVPRRWGGSELDLTTHMEIAIELGRAYGSMGWVGSFLIDHPFILAHFNEEAQQDVWGTGGPDARISTSFVPVGRVVRAPGGWSLTGDWAWASGVAYADWIMLGGMVPSGRDDHPEYRLFLVPTSELKIVDTWYSAGLRGSGSDNVEADAVFVPEHRTVAMAGLLHAHSPGAKVNTSALYNQPFMSHGGHAMVSPGIGIARGDGGGVAGPRAVEVALPYPGAGGGRDPDAVVPGRSRGPDRQRRAPAPALPRSGRLGSGDHPRGPGPQPQGHHLRQPHRGARRRRPDADGRG